jgi:hypothetical protein
MQARNLSRDDIEDIILSVTSHEGFWAHIGESIHTLFRLSDSTTPSLACSVPLRRVWLVYDHTRQIYHPFRKPGKWTEIDNKTLKE